MAPNTRAQKLVVTLFICCFLPPWQGCALLSQGAFIATSRVPWTCASAGRDQESCSIYVHIPYCRRRCRYCDFAIVPIGTTASTEMNSDDEATNGFLRMDQAYRRALANELDIIAATSPTKTTRLRSIYFGGGTPSLAPLDTLSAILSSVRNSFDVAEDAEITMEMDPGTFSREKLGQLKTMGINRISLGIQSFEDSVLEQIGRIHRRADIFESIDMIHAVFGEEVNYSIDLISGLPGVSLSDWREAVRTAVALNPKPSHLSIYDLQVEQGTVFGRWYNDDHDKLTTNTLSSQPQLPSAEQSSEMYKFASRYLREQGYEHYEISSYAYVGAGEGASPCRSQHNQIYWEPESQWFGKFF